MKHRRPIWTALLLLSLVALACDFSLGTPGQPGGTLDPKGGVLFQDDFSDPTSGWVTQRSTNQVMDYESSGFRIWVNQPNFDYWSVPGLRFTDTRIEVTAAKVAGPDDNDLGIICRYRDQNNFYGFLISNDGYYGISKRKDGDHRMISEDGMKHSGVIHTGNAQNRIRADCIGSSLALYVNDVKLVETQDTDYAVGDVGLLAGSFDTAGVDILFTNFVVRKP
jgi:hypothetical protein